MFDDRIQGPGPQHEHDVTICMPYFERSAELHAGIEAFHRHGYFDGSYFYNVGLSLCDDGSMREPLKTGDDFFKEFGARARVSHLPKKDRWDNPCVPLNRAVAQSSSPWIILQSPETIHRVDVIMPMLERATRPEISVLCPVVSRNARGALIWRAHPSRPDRLWFLQLVSRELWDEVGGCDERFRGGGGSDDRALQYRLERAGVEWVFLPEEYWAYHRKHEKAFRYKCEGNRDKIAKLYGVAPHVKHKAELSISELKRLGLYNSEVY